MHTTRSLCPALLATVAVAAVLMAGPATAAGPADSPAADPDQSMGMDMAVATGYIPTLGRALHAAGLVETLRGPGPFTLFAPTEAAFARLPPGVFDELLRPENRERLRAVLLGHVVAGNLPAGKLRTLPRVESLQGRQLELASGGDSLTVDGARVSTPDVATANGVIHMIDAVLIPPG